MDATLIDQGIDLLLYGMGTVFAFLSLLVAVTSLMSVIVNKLVVEVAPIAPVAIAPQSSVDPRIVKVIQAAIDQHRAS